MEKKVVTDSTERTEKENRPLRQLLCDKKECLLFDFSVFSVPSVANILYNYVEFLCHRGTEVTEKEREWISEEV